MVSLCLWHKWYSWLCFYFCLLYKVEICTFRKKKFLANSSSSRSLLHRNLLRCKFPKIKQILLYLLLCNCILHSNIVSLKHQLPKLYENKILISHKTVVYEFQVKTSNRNRCTINVQRMEVHHYHLPLNYWFYNYFVIKPRNTSIPTLLVEQFCFWKILTTYFL